MCRQCNYGDRLIAKLQSKNQKPCLLIWIGLSKTYSPFRLMKCLSATKIIQKENEFGHFINHREHHYQTMIKCEANEAMHFMATFISAMYDKLIKTKLRKCSKPIENSPGLLTCGWLFECASFWESSMDMLLFLYHCWTHVMFCRSLPKLLTEIQSTWCSFQWNPRMLSYRDGTKYIQKTYKGYRRLPVELGELPTHWLGFICG